MNSKKCVLYVIFVPFCIANLSQNDTELLKRETTTFPISTTSSSSYGEFMSSTTTTESVNSNNCQNECKDDVCIDGLCENQSTSISTTQVFTEKVNNNCQNGCDEEEETSKTTTTIISSVIPLDVTSNCQNGCWGGICYEGICQCKEGLILNVEINDCIMPCESTCQNGVCNQDRICECNQGFIFDTDDDDDDLTVTGCVPQCDRKCVNSICVAPTHCECIEGDISMLNISSVLECLPTCEGVDGEPGGCQNGTCVAVNKCQCLDGFFPNPYDRYECIARLTDTFDLTRKFLFLLWIISILTLSTVIVIGCLAYKRMRCVSYNIHKIEKLHSAVAFQNNHEQLDCVL